MRTVLLNNYYSATFIIVPRSAQCRNGIGQTTYYIENRCYVKYDAKMSWFGARNNCLSNHGDLASFTELSLLDGKIDSDGVWIGLRNSQWKWQYPGRQCYSYHALNEIGQCFSNRWTQGPLYFSR